MLKTVWEKQEEKIMEQRNKIDGMKTIFRNPIYKQYSDLDEVSMYRKIKDEQQKLDYMIRRWW